jgi:DNA-binding winged helix-turn-helix (wHTH) protein/TolB-like protein
MISRRTFDGIMEAHPVPSAMPAPASVVAEPLRWPGFTLDRARGELLDAQGRPVALRSQALRLLLVLAEQPGQVVGKDELMARVWGDVVVTEDSLVQAVRDVRRALCDDEHRRVRSVPKRGYMLAYEPATPFPVPQTGHRHPWRAGAAAMLLLVVLGLVGWRLTQEPPNVVEPSLRSLAILPFEGDGTVPDWLLEALGADLAIKAASWEKVFTVGRGSLREYRGKHPDPRAVAASFGVRYVVSGQARQREGSIVLDLTMVDGRTGKIAWADQIGIERARLEHSVGDIASGIARVLLAEWGREIGRQTRTLTSKQIEADDLAMQAMSIYLKGIGPDSFRQAQVLFETALDQDPRSLRALHGVNQTHAMGVIYRWAEDPAASARRAEEMLARMEEIDTRSFHTLDARATVLIMRADWQRLLDVSALLLQNYPNDHTSHHIRCSALLRLGRFEDSMVSCERALLISARDSRAAVWHGLIAMNLFMLGRYEASAERAARSTTLNTRLPFYRLLLAAALERAGRSREALEVIAQARSAHPDVGAADVRSMWPATQPDFVTGRERIAETVRALGLP